jgi:hypothetical protein
MMWSKPPLAPPEEGDYCSEGVRDKIVFEIR